MGSLYNMPHIYIFSYNIMGYFSEGLFFIKLYKYLNYFRKLYRQILRWNVTIFKQPPGIGSRLRRFLYPFRKSIETNGHLPFFVSPRTPKFQCSEGSEKNRVSQRVHTFLNIAIWGVRRFSKIFM